MSISGASIQAADFTSISANVNPVKAPLDPEDPVLEELRKLSRDLVTIRIHIDKHFEVTKTSQEWNTIGLIIDRLLFGMYIVFIIVSFITMISIWIHHWSYSSWLSWRIQVKSWRFLLPTPSKCKLCFLHWNWSKTLVYRLCKKYIYVISQHTWCGMGCLKAFVCLHVMSLFCLAVINVLYVRNYRSWTQPDREGERERIICVCMDTVELTEWLDIPHLQDIRRSLPIYFTDDTYLKSLKELY